MQIIGHIRACIAGDRRYTSLLEVGLEDGKAHIVLKETVASGGMDGRGGADPFRVTDTRIVDAHSKAIVAAVKLTMDSTIKVYGKPTKNFEWVGVKERGINGSLVERALAYARGDSDDEE